MLKYVLNVFCQFFSRVYLLFFACLIIFKIAKKLVYKYELIHELPLVHIRDTIDNGCCPHQLFNTLKQLNFDNIVKQKNQ